MLPKNLRHFFSNVLSFQFFQGCPKAFTQCEAATGNPTCFAAHFVRGVPGVIKATTGNEASLKKYLDNYAYAPSFGCYNAATEFKLDGVKVTSTAGGENCVLKKKTDTAVAEAITGFENAVPSFLDTHVTVGRVDDSIRIFTCK